MYSYGDFVGEVEGLVESGKMMLNKPAITEESSPFRRWKHNLEDAIKRIHDEGYEVNTKLKSRYFRPMYPCSETEKWRHLHTELDQTLIELQTVLENQLRYGPPRRKPDKRSPVQTGTQQPLVGAVVPDTVPPIIGPGLPETREPLAPPERVTFPWLVKHVSVTVWWTAVLGAVAVFSTGVAVGQLWSKLLP